MAAEQGNLAPCEHVPYCSRPVYSGVEHEHPVLLSAYADMERLGVTLGLAATLMQSTLMLAATVDMTSSGRDLPGLTRELRNCLEDLAKVKPAADDDGDALDDLAARRAGRAATA
jgi:hypothetical protein